MSQRLVRNAAKCLLCGDVVESRHRHDFRSCSCGAMSVDGGKSYSRRLFKNIGDWEDLCEYEDEEELGHERDEACAA